MKKELYIIFLLIFLLTPLTLAEQEIPATDSRPPTPELSALRGGLEDKTENILEKEISLSENTKNIMRLIFGLKEDAPATISGLIVLLAVWLMVLIIIMNILGVTPLFNESWQKILGGIIITTLISMAGTLGSLNTLIYNIGNSLTILEKLGPFKMLAIAGMIIIVILVISHFSGWINKSKRLEKSEKAGRDISLMRKMAEMNAKENK
jgi:amino acid transporter